MAETAAVLFDRLITIMRTLRSPEGCPWDRQQTLASLRPYLLEETYEALDALDADRDAAISEELGDLLFEIVFLAQIGAEAGRFTIAEALESITQKLVRRHPHVFGDAPRIATAEEVPGRWEAMKAAERAGADQSHGILGGVPASLPALLRAYELGSRAASVGFDWDRASDVMAKIEEEVAELRAEVTNP
ncbi:MAG TPA: nucleoside triphosphate pyrophosphohydrolase, partial [Vicinamibacterales bacterium]